MCMRVFSNNYLQLGKCTVHMSAWQKYWFVPKTYTVSKYWFTPKSTVLFYVFICLYLIGAPLAWAGLSSTVMVVAVSLRKASDPSYSSIVGAEERTEVCINIHDSLCSLCKFDIIKMCKNKEYCSIFNTWNIRSHIQCGCGTKPFGGGCTYR